MWQFEFEDAGTATLLREREHTAVPIDEFVQCRPVLARVLQSLRGRSLNLSYLDRGDNADGIRCFLCGISSSPSCTQKSYQNITCSSSISSCMVLYTTNKKDEVQLRGCGLVNKNVTNKDCLSNTQDSSSGKSGYGCFCTADLCNAAGAPVPAGLALGVSLVAFVVSRKIAS
ncbi:unnamed protein product [Darwinula stevensoni]|uniref:Protein sleepless n=1 Tax=Darwinula stevensoni TaxID=69355 RepID=A0A7R8X7B2_9CRUS|nr:unnamed protein product [Darwinula stevensoni]CAG0882375.1 unnamed protein product [Darwinula stevensoni]